MVGLTRLITNLNEFETLIEKPNILREIGGGPISYFIIKKLVEDPVLNILKYLQEKLPNHNFSFEVLDSNENKTLLKIDLKRRRGEKIWEKDFLILVIDDIIYSIFDHHPNEIGNVIPTFLNKFYPFAETYHYKSKDITNFLDNLIQQGVNIICPKFSKKTQYSTDTIKTETDVKYCPNHKYTELREELSSKLISINSISVEGYNDAKLLLYNFTMFRSGMIKFIDGDFAAFNNQVIPSLIESKNISLMTDYSSKDLIQLKSPKRIDYYGFKNINEQIVINEFGKLINNNNSIAVSILHNGNPFYQAKIIDVFDGSVFSVIFTFHEGIPRLFVIPGIYASNYSVAKFCGTISSKFGEGEISDAEEDNN